MHYFLGLASFFKARHLFWLPAVARPAKGGVGAAAAIQQPPGNRTSSGNWPRSLLIIEHSPVDFIDLFLRHFIRH